MPGRGAPQLPVVLAGVAVAVEGHGEDVDEEQALGADVQEVAAPWEGGRQLRLQVVIERAAVGVRAVSEADDHDHGGVHEGQEGEEGAVGQGREVLQQAEGQCREEGEADEAGVPRQGHAQRRHDLLEQVAEVAGIAEERAEGHDDNHQQRDPGAPGADDQRPLRGEVVFVGDLAGPSAAPHGVHAEAVEDDHDEACPDEACAVHAVGDGQEAGRAQVRHDVHHEGKGRHGLLVLLGPPHRRAPDLWGCLPGQGAKPQSDLLVGAGCLLVRVRTSFLARRGGYVVGEPAMIRR
mmetsp:Transcript_5186/g.16794  ORF Transcript_5186/g.16794 Transcript_5186/m.16794 type:complete len:293 (+) Transcript_5186:770-1648(+)